MNSKMMKNIGLVLLVVILVSGAVYYYQSMNVPQMEAPSS